MGTFLRSLLILCGLFILTPYLSAQDADPPVIDESAIILGETPLSSPGEEVSSLMVVFRMVLVLALAALAIYGVVFFIKRLARPQEIKDPHLKILARIPLTNDSYAAVLSVGAKAWLVGGAAGGINLIAEIDDPESLETMLLDDARRTAEAETRRFPDFRSLLSKRGLPPDTANQASELPPDDERSIQLRRQLDRLRGLP
ncbi:MAG: flagellar biosynthetic protein FliO [Treponema sp.]|nr:flagellar biosynthetic protein FliO [Treponema sp.]